MMSEQSIESPGEFTPEADIQPVGDPNLELIRASVLFDSDWYLREYPDVAATGIDPAVHYLSFGARESRNPSPHFHTGWYVEQHPDVAEGGWNPLVHYLNFGQSEDRPTKPVAEKSAESKLRAELLSLTESGLFDRSWYLHAYPHVAELAVDPAIHYLQTGGFEGFHPSLVFSTRWYLERHPELIHGRENPLIHYLGHASGEERAVVADLISILSSDLFDADWYSQRYCVAAEANPLFDYFFSSEIRQPGPRFDAKAYLYENRDVAEAKINPLLHYLVYGRGEERRIHALGLDELLGIPTVPEAVRSRFNELQIRAYPIPKAPRRILILGESAESPQTGTALLFAATLAARIEASLALIPQQPAPPTWDLDDFFLKNAVRWQQNLQILRTPFHDSNSLAISDNDLFIATSCAGARALVPYVDPSHVIHLICEDERLLHPSGDEKLRCHEILAHPETIPVVESRMLFEHLTSGLSGLATIKQTGTWFERAFPDTILSSPAIPDNRQKRQFLFYAEPDFAPSLYWRGLQAIDQAVALGVLREEECDITFFGTAPTEVLLAGRIQPHLLSLTPWQQQTCLPPADVALAMLDAPAPGFAPLVLAANGALVITSSSGSKTSLLSYSPNISCVEPSLEAIGNAIQEAVNAVVIGPVRSGATTRTFPAAWDAAFDSSLQSVVARLGLSK